MLTGIAQAQEQDAMSDADFESDEEEIEEPIGGVVENGTSEDERPSKKMRAS